MSKLILQYFTPFFCYNNIPLTSYDHLYLSDLLTTSLFKPVIEPFLPTYSPIDIDICGFLYPFESNLIGAKYLVPARVVYISFSPYWQQTLN